MMFNTKSSRVRVRLYSSETSTNLRLTLGTHPLQAKGLLFGVSTNEQTIIFIMEKSAHYFLDLLIHLFANKIQKK